MAPLTLAGFVLVSGGAVAAALAALVGAGLGGVAIKEVLDRYTANRHSSEFAAALRGRGGAAVGSLRRYRARGDRGAACSPKPAGGMSMSMRGRRSAWLPAQKIFAAS